MNGRDELKIEPKVIYNEICKVYVDNEVSYRLVSNGIKNFNSGIDSIQDTFSYGRPCISVTPKNTSKVSEVSNSDARYMSYEIHVARMTGILEASAHMILKKNLEFTRKVSRCIPHILTNEQKGARRK